MEPEFTGVELVLGGAVFLAGLSLGLAFSRGGREARRRVRVLEAELVEVNERLAAYRGQVENHFAQTSDLFAELTRQYAAVWDHLAEGARSLCPERVPSLGRGFTAGPALLKQAPAAEEPASEASSPSSAPGDVEPLQGDADTTTPPVHSAAGAASGSLDRGKAGSGQPVPGAGVGAR